MPPVLRNLLLYWFPILLYVGLIFLVSSLSLSVRLPSFAYADKVMHFAEYTFLAFLMARAINSFSWPKSFMGVWMISFGACVLLGGLDELYQSTVPTRDADWFDLLADGVGGLTGSFTYLGLHRLFSRNGAKSDPTDARAE